MFCIWHHPMTLNFSDPATKCDLRDSEKPKMMTLALFNPSHPDPLPLLEFQAFIHCALLFLWRTSMIWNSMCLLVTNSVLGLFYFPFTLDRFSLPCRDSVIGRSLCVLESCWATSCQPCWLRERHLQSFKLRLTNTSRLLSDSFQAVTAVFHFQGLIPV